ncbi:MAG TPA: hypothetical protein VF522_23320 [Ramlibacter sp.]|uniref:hypothetical protein n=1 Tax=Ramlibacter sp. TaxID=1917967 RepID=UPI002ED48D9F
MSAEDVALLLALLGGTSVATSWLGRRKGDAPRDVRLLSAFGSVLLSAAAATYFA